MERSWVGKIVSLLLTTAVLSLYLHSIFDQSKVDLLIGLVSPEPERAIKDKVVR